MEHFPEVNDVLDAIARGEKEAFRHLIKRFELPVRSYLAARIYRLDEVDDIAQEVFIAAWKQLQTFERSRDFVSWLLGIARHKMLEHLRSKGRRESALERFHVEVALLTEGSESRIQADQIERLLECITLLPDKLRRVIRMGLDGVRPAVLAGELETSVPAVYQLHYRASQMLRECMKKNPHEH